MSVSPKSESSPQTFGRDSGKPSLQTLGRSQASPSSNTLVKPPELTPPSASQPCSSADARRCCTRRHNRSPARPRRASATSSPRSAKRFNRSTNGCHPRPCRAPPLRHTTCVGEAPKRKRGHDSCRSLGGSCANCVDYSPGNAGGRAPGIYRGTSAPAQAPQQRKPHGVGCRSSGEGTRDTSQRRRW